MMESNNPASENSTESSNTTQIETEEVYVTEEVSFDQAKQDELTSWKNNVCKEVQKSNSNQKCISLRWEWALKETKDGIKPKARLVAQGFEEDNLSEIQKDSPTCSKDTLRAVLSIICQRKCNIQSIDIKTAFLQGDIDIKTAFLQGDSLKREIFVKQLPEAQCDFSILWKLNKCVYGLTDASLMWYNRIIKFVTKCNSKVSKIDPALFLWHKNMNLEGFTIVQVDDFQWAGTENFKQTVISQLKETFHIGKIENTIFNFLGLKLNQINEGITVDQYDYTRSLEMIKIDPSRKRDLNQPLTLIETDLLQSKIGQLL